MKIEQRPLYMKHLITLSKDATSKEWEKWLNTLQILELYEGLYPSDQLFLSMKDIQDSNEISFKLYMPINWSTDIPPELSSSTFTKEVSKINHKKELYFLTLILL